MPTIMVDRKHILGSSISEITIFCNSTPKTSQVKISKIWLHLIVDNLQMNQCTKFHRTRQQIVGEEGLRRSSLKMTFLPQKWPPSPKFKNPAPFVCQHYPQEAMCRVSKSSDENCERRSDSKQNIWKHTFCPKTRLETQN